MTRADVDAAAVRIAPYIRRTSIIALRNGLGLKAESLQPTGSFKIRGAFNSILSLSNAERACGVIAHSSGNHGQAVAYAAHRLG
ncbi:MAG TPA: pyridoxal-phosphate dependent enzyme, partial [Verrucomicrobiae bacterium]|nr:pyridoxal-phosphate dependent enzyme [Verrucomicrobiae bacterium]